MRIASPKQATANPKKPTWSPSHIAQSLLTPEHVVQRWKSLLKGANSSASMQSRRLLNDLLAKCIAALKTRHPDTSTRLAAIRFIRIIGWKKALPTLLAVARGPSQDPHYLVRASAINALANLGETRAIPFLIKVLNDSNDEVRLAAMLAFLPFAKFKDKSIVAALESKLYGPTMDPRKWLRREAVYILGQLGYGRAPSILKRALRDSDPKIRQLAAAALQKLIRVSPSGFSR